MAKIKYYKNKSWLYRKLYIEQMTPEEIAKEADCAVSTIYNWIEKHGFNWKK